MKATLRFLAWSRGATLPSHLCKYSAGRINRIFMKEAKIKVFPNSWRLPGSFSKCRFSGPVSDLVNQSSCGLRLENLKIPPANLCDYILGLTPKRKKKTLFVDLGPGFSAI